jgi:hypothetical protein
VGTAVIPLVLVAIYAVGKVGVLGGKSGGVFPCDGCAIGLDEGEVFAAEAEGEVGVEFGSCAVFVGGEDDEILIGVEGAGGELPFGEVGSVVGEIPAREV